MEVKVLASGSSGNAYRISDGETALLLDAGIPLKAIQAGLGFRVRDIMGCFVTHAHKDHSKAAKDLARLGETSTPVRAPRTPAASRATA